MRCLRFVLALGVVLMFGGVGAAQEQKGASPTAREHASDQAIFNRVSDWFATVGKSGKEKQKIIAERKAKRAQKRLEKEAKKHARKAEGLTKEAKEKTRQASREMKRAGQDGPPGFDQPAARVKMMSHEGPIPGTTGKRKSSSKKGPGPR